MRGRRIRVTLIGIGLTGLMAATAGCSSSSGGASGSTTSAAAKGATTTAGGVTPTTVAALTTAGADAAKTLQDTSGFSAEQSACLVSTVVARVGETDGLPLFGNSPAELTTAQQDALVAGFEGCLTPDDLGGLVGVTVQSIASSAGATLSREQVICSGRALIGAYTLRNLLFDQSLLEKVFADEASMTTLLTTCVSATVAAGVAKAASGVAQDRVAQSGARDALVGAKAAASSASTYKDITQDVLAKGAPKLTFVADAGPSTGPTQVSWKLTGTTLTVAVRSVTGACYLLRDDVDDDGTVAKTPYAKVEAPTTGPAAPCTATTVAADVFTDTW